MFAKTELVDLLPSEDLAIREGAMRRLGIAGEDELLPFPPAFLPTAITGFGLPRPAS